jgi:DTW domain-containing protein YfiP
VCDISPRLTLATRVVLVIHAREWRRQSNTGRLVQLAAPKAEVRLHGALGAAPGAAGEGIDADDPGTLVLFPGRRSRPLTPELRATLPARVTLVVPDGNWTQTRHMMTRLAPLARARTIELPGPAPGAARLRKNVFDERMSTFEAVAQVLGILEGEPVEAALTDYFRRVVDRMLCLRGKKKAAEIYGGLTHGPAKCEPSTGEFL